MRENKHRRNKRFGRALPLALLLAVAWEAGLPGAADAENLISFKWNRQPPPQSFPAVYTEVPGVLTFRGSADRASPAYGTVAMKAFRPAKAWALKTKASSWGGGAGWTGQPAIVQWPPDVLRTMNVKAKFRNEPGFTEVIYASLDGYVYFMDLESGEESRPPIRIGNPIKGSVSVDARGYPLLYVGEGIPEKGTIGFGLYSLIDGKKLYSANGLDSYAKRGWGAFDGSALFNRETDSLIVGGENGLFYDVKLNTRYDRSKGTLSIRPEVSKYKYAVSGNKYQGIENSVAAVGELAFFADNGGSLQALNLRTGKPAWALPATDDTDATIVVGAEDGKPYLYTGTEVDKQGDRGFAILRKIDGTTGRTVWEKKYLCYTQRGDHAVNGGLLATPVLGKGAIGDRVVFTLARYGSFGGGLTIALDKRTGDEIWRQPMKHYAWSSPVDVYDKDGRAYLVQADSSGTVSLLSGATGTTLGSVSVGANIESTPAVFGNRIVVASRGGYLYGFKLE
ncbi:PQQ-binding-like beta-propeller repeat protein [Cohnella zeiphila]|uniref:PQQ-binding-like beta-propeller repeat protein n=1 Tax=Cohnella zeiphila TaxID=2761120 RepID=A0A7X0VX27_9BACL|nr:PQQ-binding-like beta-propeller repeat protein [Cohnella zeiphila]MBB6733581.1 PQQ-binding-like beta-propeller repeat protein [Cohnella zeiphila]